MTQGAKVVLRRRIKAAPEKVFEACTRAELLERWLGPEGFTVCKVETDLRVGGHFTLRMRGERGVYAAEGVYREIVHGARLVLTWLWTEAPEGEEPDSGESLVTFELRPDGDGTLLTLTHEGLADQETAESHGEGWGEELDKLTALMA